MFQFPFTEAVSASVSALATVAAFGYAIYQVWVTKQSSRELDAQQAYRDYLKLCVERPELSSSLVFAKSRGLKTFIGADMSLTPDTEAYLWFVTIVLSTCEAILDRVASRGPWRRALKSQIRHHQPVLEAHWDKWQKAYSERTRLLVASVLAEGPEEDWKAYMKSTT